MNAQINITVGLIYWRQIRDLVDRMKFLGHQIDLWESSGWIERDFIIRGDDEAIRVASTALNRWRREIGERPANAPL
jgi:hypothetical protein